MITQLNLDPPRLTLMLMASPGLPLPTQDEGEFLSKVLMFNVSQINVLSVSVVEMCKATRSDPI